jgi:5'-nucleotidase
MVYTIGLDLDGVSAHYYRGISADIHQMLGTPLDQMAKIPYYSLYKSGWGFTSEEHFREIHGKAVDTGLYERLDPFEGVSEALWRLSDDGFEIHVITSRFVNHGQNAKVVAQTVAWLDEHNIPFRDISFTRDKRRIMADIYIDDSPSNIVSLREAGRHVLTFDAEYNRDIDGPRAANWAEAEKYVRDHAASLIA